MLHALAGLPRSGSTLLGNVLAQHPDVFVSGTSPVESCVEAVVQVLSNSPEVVGHLSNVDDAYEDYLSAMRGFVDGWYRDEIATHAHIVDKSRGWVLRPDLLRQLEPESVLIVTVRDPRDVVASIEEQHRATAVFNSPIAETLYQRAEKLMEPTGMVGGPIRWIEDLFRKSTPAVYVEYEALTVAPEVQVSKVATAMGLKPFDFDFDRVVNISTDLDAVHRNKYPHKGQGAIRPQEKHWSDTLDPELAELILKPAHIQHYLRTFGYNDKSYPPPRAISSAPTAKPRPTARTGAPSKKPPSAKKGRSIKA